MEMTGRPDGAKRTGANPLLEYYELRLVEHKRATARNWVFI